MPYRPAFNRHLLPKPVGCFVYCYLRTDSNKPYYVGLGSRPDRLTARHCVKVPRDWGRIRILRQGLTLEEAKEWEQFYIARFGRKTMGTGCLLNQREGGEGDLLCPELRARIAASVRALHEAGVYASINSPESIKRRVYNRQANKAAELKLPVDAYLAMPKQKRDQFVQWRKANPEAPYQEWLDTRKTAATASKYKLTVEEWEQLTRKQKNALKEWMVKCPEADPHEYLQGLRRRSGPAPKIDKDEVLRLVATGISQTAVAKQLGCQQSTVSRIVNGVRQLDKHRASA